MVTEDRLKMTHPLLSICINTRNRGNVISETLDSIVEQIVPGIEIVVVDGASEDNTQQVMQQYDSRYPFVKYLRSESGLGVDDGYDAAVEYSSGEYCWLMTDDDVIVPGAMKTILGRISAGHDLIILNLECFTKDLSLDLNQRLFNCYEDRRYSRDDFGSFLGELGYGLSYIGCVIIKRSLWFENDRAPFYGTYFVHVGVICGSSKIRDIAFLHAPLIKYRSGNSSWTARSFEIWYFKWPRLIWSFSNLPTDVKNKVAVQRPWGRALTLLKSRAMGEYNHELFKEYLSIEGPKWGRFSSYFISKLPIVPVSLLLILFCLLFRRRGLYTLYNLMISSPQPAMSRKLIRAFGLNLPYSVN
jgi:glycosyltransferase involved in cell wall biosynthesis